MFMTKEWVVVHKIRSLYDDGYGLSIRAISQELGVSRNTVRKYLRMSDSDILLAQRNDRSNSGRYRLEFLFPYIQHMLDQFPNLQAARSAKKVISKFPSLDISERALRRYIRSIKESGEVARRASYGEPIMDMVPGLQCQVHADVIPNVNLAGAPQHVYVVGFVLSFSKKLFVDLQLEPYAVNSLIDAHNAAFCAFDGIPEECVYDKSGQPGLFQVINQPAANQKLHQFAAGMGFRTRIIDHYQPDIAYKIEPVIRNLQESVLASKAFISESSLRGQVRGWVENTANRTTNHLTGHSPDELFKSAEKDFLRRYQHLSFRAGQADICRVSV